MKPTIRKGDKRTINGWAMYDWANSVYSLVITTAIFPIYYFAITNAPDGTNQVVYFFGLPVNNDSLYSYSLSGAFLIATAISPFLSGIADYTGYKKAFMKFFCYLGSLSCALLFFFTDISRLELGVLAFIFASVGFTGSIVFYNAFLPEIAEPKDQDRVSAKGFAMGYIGSVLLLVINLGLILKPELIFDVSDKAASLAAANPGWTGEQIADAVDTYFSSLTSRIAFLTVGVWWFGFAQITFRRLPKYVYHCKLSNQLLKKGYLEIRKVWFQLGSYGALKTYVFAFFFFSLGLQTVLYMATPFATDELGLEAYMLIVIVLIIQLIAIPGAYLFSFLSAIFGNIASLIVMLFIWIGVTTYAYFVQDAFGFMIAAGVVGLVMGGVQSLSRSTYSKLLPDTIDHASYFSFYDVAEKLSIVMGTLVFGLVNDATGSMRNSIFAIIIFFVIGLVLLFMVRQKVNDQQGRNVLRKSSR